MSDIRRYSEEQIVDGYVTRAGIGVNPSLGTEPIYVTYADHVAAVQQAEQRGRESLNQEALLWGYRQGQRDVYDNRFVFTHDQWADECDRLSELALAAAVQRVEALAFDHENGHGVLIVPTAEVIAAIKGGSDE